MVYNQILALTIRSTVIKPVVEIKVVSIPLLAVSHSIVTALVIEI